MQSGRLPKGEKIAQNQSKKRKKLISIRVIKQHEEEEEEEEERERERTKENLYDGYAAILLRILRRVPHARFRDRSKTTHFRI